MPKSSERTGVNSASNIVAACHICNRFKSSYVAESFADARLYVMNKLHAADVYVVAEPNIIKPRLARKCEFCEEEYVSGHENARFCSDSCRIKAWEAENPRERVHREGFISRRDTRTCSVCKGEYERTSARDSYCSTACRMAGWKQTLIQI